ncbi:MAG TPA: FAD-dependent oxidoreductase [Gaiellaceae bacterium]|nr:FAD-dependent oxidoreductase [Gaiellaceae bacterium]
MAERTNVVIVGGGVAALEGALALRALAPEAIDVEVVAPDEDFTYRPMLVAEPFGHGSVRTFPLRRLAEAAGARFRQAIVTDVDAENRVARTASSDTIPYDELLLATGAVPVTAVPGALCFRGPNEADGLERVMDRAATGEIDRIVFAVPAGAAWALPLYELALLARAWLVDEGSSGVDVIVVTAEDAPLALFGSAASDAVSQLLAARGIGLVTSATPLAFSDGVLTTAPNGVVEADVAVALPRLEGPRIAGVPHDSQGFIPTDDYGQVAGEVDVWAAGDATTFPLKQGGIAAQQADAAAESIAARAGLPVDPQPFRPVLRGLLLTGMVPRFLRAEPGTPASMVDTEPLWWPPAKIVGRYLAPFLAKHLGLSETVPEASRRNAVTVEVELAPWRPSEWSEV